MRPLILAQPIVEGSYSGTVRGFMSKVAVSERGSKDAGRALCKLGFSEGSCRSRPRAGVALLSNPKSTGNIAQLPRIRAYCADHPNVFHYEVEEASQIGEAMRSIARI